MVLKMYMGQRKLNETFEGGIGSFLLQVCSIIVSFSPTATKSCLYYLPGHTP